MPHGKALRNRVLDETDRKIMMMLQENGRESLTNIAKKVGISIDSVNNRIREMLHKGIFEIGIFIVPNKIGYPLIAEVKIKLKNISTGEKAKFISYLKSYPQVTELLSIMGEFDLTCVLIAKDTKQMEQQATEIRQKFAHIISDWVSVMVLETHKFEYYDVKHL